MSSRASLDAAEAAITRAGAELAMPARPGTSRRVLVCEGDSAVWQDDVVTTEEPLEIRLRAGGRRATVAVTMRTPGDDFALAAGFLYGEGILRTAADLTGISYCVDRETDAEQRFNIVNVDLAVPALPELRGLDRHFATTSACGVCGKTSLDALALRGIAPVSLGSPVAAATIRALPGRLRPAQGLFARTGGLHAAGLFDRDGGLLDAREDVGRHNALDKLVGHALLAGRLPLADHVALVSGRASFELVQKAVAAGIGVLGAVSAPSSLAIETAERFGLTLAGFVRGERFVVYTGAERVAGLTAGA